MGDKSNIEWTDASWNPTRGCDLISPGCKNCYAKAFAERFRGVEGHAYERGFDPREAPEMLDQPLRWRKPRRIFVNSMSDLWHEAFSDDYLDHVLAVMALCPQHTFQVLTKRADRMRSYMSADHRAAYIEGRAKRIALERGTPIPPGKMLRWPLANVWLGVSVESQTFADKRIPELLKTPAAVRFLSCEPLLGPVDLQRFTPFLDARLADELGQLAGADPGSGFVVAKTDHLPRIDWVIVGGESGAGARTCNVTWIRSLVLQCAAAGVPCFVKQLGAHPYVKTSTSASIEKNAPGVSFKMKIVEASFESTMALRDRKGGDMSEWPEDLRVRQFPESPASAGNGAPR